MWLTEEERKRTSPAEKADFVSPVPTQIVSNGEYNPIPQTAQQKQVEGRIKEIADKYAHRLNMDRRTFLKTSSGMAVAFLAMNEVFGPVWNVSEAEAADTDVSDSLGCVLIAERGEACRARGAIKRKILGRVDPVEVGIQEPRTRQSLKDPGFDQAQTKAHVVDRH